MTGTYAQGFESVDREYSHHVLGTDGELPEWLSGSLIRNGPGRFDVGNHRVEHWFDGLAMLTKFNFNSGTVTYSNRFLRTDEYQEVMEHGRYASAQFGTARQGILSRIKDWILPSTTDNANVNVLRLGDRYVAITETQIGVEFDPKTLETIDHYPFNDLAGQMMTAHPHVDPSNNEIVTFTTDFGRESYYRFYKSSLDNARFREIGAVPTNRPAYIHSIGLTSNHIVLAEFPFDVNPFKLLLPGDTSFIERYQWRPEKGTRFVVIDRHTGHVKNEYTTAPFFAFHHANAFEEKNQLIVDIATFDDPSVINSLYLEDLMTGSFPSLEGELTRFRVPLGKGEVATETVYSNGITLPRISPKRNALPYRYAYGQGAPNASKELPQRLLKVDTEARSATTWAEPDTFCGEPVFVPNPSGRREDAGVVLSVILDAAAEQSALLVLDAETFTELSRWHLPHVVPFDFHGQFFTDQ